MHTKLAMTVLAAILLSGSSTYISEDGTPVDLSEYAIKWSDIAYSRTITIKCGGEYDEKTKTITPNPQDICKLVTCMTSYTVGVCGELAGKIIAADGAKLCLVIDGKPSCVDVVEDK